MTTQKEIARALDRAAIRTEASGREPATTKQIWFLAGLMAQKGEDGSEFLLNQNQLLTKADASALIETALGAKPKPKAASVVAKVPTAEEIAAKVEADAEAKATRAAAKTAAIQHLSEKGITRTGGNAQWWSNQIYDAEKALGLR